MTAIERKPISAGDTEKMKQETSMQRQQDALIGASRGAGQAAADAWSIWMTAYQDLAAQQIRLMGQMMDRLVRSPLDSLPALREAEVAPVRNTRLARETCQRMVQSVRAANDAALGWYFDLADRAAAQLAQQLPGQRSATNIAGTSSPDRAQ